MLARGAMTTAKNDVFIFFIGGEEIEIWWWGGELADFQLVDGGTLLIPPVGKTLYIYIIHIHVIYVNI